MEEGGGSPNMGCERAKSKQRETPPVTGEAPELIVVFAALPAAQHRQSARVLRLASNNLGGEPERVDVRQVRFRDAVSPEHRMGDHRPDLRPFAHRDLWRSGRERGAGVRKE